MSRIQYGSLEETIHKDRHHHEREDDDSEDSDKEMGNHNSKKTLDQLENANEIEISEDQKALLKDFERQKMARRLAVPTDDLKVRQRLRSIGEPQTLFGEGPAERRDRLRHILSLRLEQGLPLMPGTEGVEDEEMDQEMKEGDKESDEEEEEEEFYTYGSQELLEARRVLTAYSLPRAKNRLENQRKEIQLSVPARKKIKHNWYTNLKTFATFSSQFGDDRPLTYCQFSPNSRLLATGSWSGLIKLWNVPGCDCAHVLKGHKDRVSGIAFHPRSTLSQSPNALNLVSAGVNGSVHLWSFGTHTPIASLEGHEMRVARVAFHPSGKFIGTSSFDMTWRLWDAETQAELLLQEGHSKEVFALGFQGDGALAASGGMDSIGRIWDLRTGKSVMVLQGHIKPILSLDWAPNGYQLATGSEDNSIRIWDIRSPGRFGSSYTIPAHTNIVTQVKYFSPSERFGGEVNELSSNESFDFKKWISDSTGEENGLGEHHQNMNVDENDDDQTLEYCKYPNLVLDDQKTINRNVLAGSYLVSSSYDGTCKVWTEGDWKPVKVLSGLEGKIMCCDVSSDGRFISTAAYDRTFKLHASENISLL